MNRNLQEIKEGKRFQFGKNWNSFLSNITDERIKEAELSLQDMFGVESFKGLSFIDIGSGSGLFSLAAKNIGAEKIHSIDFDPFSVLCTQTLKEKYHTNSENWFIEEASILDKEYIGTLGKFDVVYSWGVLHHTGSMWEAFNNVVEPVVENGALLIAIYNDQHGISNIWKVIKRLYCKNVILKYLITFVFFPLFFIAEIIVSTIKYKNPFRKMVLHKKKRGMSIYHDWIDWLGGYPFEVAKPEEILKYFSGRGFRLIKITTTNGSGCNQFLFKKE